MERAMINWARVRDRKRMSQQGTECASDPDPTFMAPLLRGRRRRPTRPLLTKAQLRELGARLNDDWQARRDR
jgi:hypothetical protein